MARKFNAGLERPVATHVYNSFDRERFDPDAGRAGAASASELGIAPTAALLGQIAQITPWKAQDTSIRALAQLHRSGLDAHLLIVGKIAFSGKGVRYDNEGYLRGPARAGRASWRARTASTSSASAATSRGSCASSTCRCSPPGTSRSPT